MKVKCINNNLFAVKNSAATTSLSHYIRLTDGNLDIEVNQVYTVYGIEFRDNSPWFYLCPDNDSEYPKPYAHVFFEILDDRLSRYWRLATEQSINNSTEARLVIKEWAENSFFYELLLDGDDKISDVFSRMREVLDNEYE